MPLPTNFCTGIIGLVGRFDEIYPEWIKARCGNRRLATIVIGILAGPGLASGPSLAGLVGRRAQPIKLPAVCA
jgi:hypothetical protein